MNRTLAAEGIDGKRVTGRRLPVSIVIPAYGAAAQLGALPRESGPPRAARLRGDRRRRCDTRRQSSPRWPTAFRSKLSLDLRAAREQSRIRRELQRGHPVDSAERRRRPVAQLRHSGHGGISRGDVGGPAPPREARRRLAPEQQRHHLLGAGVGAAAAGRRLSALEVDSRPAAALSGDADGGRLLPADQERRFFVSWACSTRSTVRATTRRTTSICRINRHGYSAVAAHQAFVFIYESSSFGARRKALELRNRQELDTRYPEYSRKIAEHCATASIRSITSRCSGGRIARQSCSICSIFRRRTREPQISRSACCCTWPRCSNRRYDVSLGLSEEARQFFAHELTGYRFYDREAPGRRAIRSRLQTVADFYVDRAPPHGQARRPDCVYAPGHHRCSLRLSQRLRARGRSSGPQR